MTELEKKLTPKQRLFCEYYIGEARQNATRAAMLAGYSKKTARQMGSENLSKPDISGYIDDRLKELTLSANAVLVRLTEIANGKVTYFLDDQNRFDLETAKKNGNDHLLKKVKIKRTLREVKRESDSHINLTDDEEAEEILETSVIFEEIEFEIHSSHEALRDIGKAHKLFVDRVDINANVSGNLDMNIQAAIAEVYGEKKESDGDGNTDLENE